MVMGAYKVLYSIYISRERERNAQTVGKVEYHFCVQCTKTSEQREVTPTPTHYQDFTNTAGSRQLRSAGPGAISRETKTDLLSPLSILPEHGL